MVVEYLCNGKEMQVEVSELSNAELLPLLCEKIEIKGGCGYTEQLDAEINELRTEIKRRLSYYQYRD